MEKLLTQRLANQRFKGLTIKSLDVRACNKIQFNFMDGSFAVLHIECNRHGLPEVAWCDSCGETHGRLKKLADGKPANVSVLRKVAK